MKYAFNFKKPFERFDADHRKDRSPILNLLFLLVAIPFEIILTILTIPFLIISALITVFGALATVLSGAIISITGALIGGGIILAICLWCLWALAWSWPILLTGGILLLTLCLIVWLVSTLVRRLS